MTYLVGGRRDGKKTLHRKQPNADENIPSAYGGTDGGLVANRRCRWRHCLLYTAGGGSGPRCGAVLRLVCASCGGGGGDLFGVNRVVVVVAI